MEKIPGRYPAAMLALISIFTLIFWILMMFFALLFGGSPGPYSSERTFPLLYVGIIALGGLGSLLALIAGFIGFITKTVVKTLPICAVVLGALGSLPFFLLDLTLMGLFVLLPGMFPPLLYLLLTRKSSGKRT